MKCCLNQSDIRIELFHLLNCCTKHACQTKKKAVEPLHEAEPQTSCERELLVVGRVLRVLTRDADHLPPAHDENDRQQDVNTVVETRL